MSRVGKIGRLPGVVRERLNQLLADGETGARLLEWLNGLPETQRVLAAEFQGAPINKQNLSDWKAGGFRAWRVQRETWSRAGELMAQVDALKPSGTQGLTDSLALAVAARYAAALMDHAPGKEGALARQLKVLRELCHDVGELRRGDHSAARLQLERDRFKRETQTDHDRWMDIYIKELKEFPDVVKVYRDAFQFYVKRKKEVGDSQG